MSRYANMVPYCNSIAAMLNKKFFALPYALWILIAFMLVIGFLARKTKQLTWGGALSAVLIGFGITWILGFGALFTMLLFFIGAAFLGRIAKDYRKRTEMPVQKKGGCRDTMQVFANGGLSLVFAVCYAIYPHQAFLMMFAASIAEAASDTASGEVGILSKETPVSLVTGKPLPKGLSGAITTLGTTSGLVASLLIALCWMSNFYAPSTHALLLCVIVAACGFVGAVFDSFLGCTCQACYYDERHDRLTEHEGEDGVKFTLRHGLPWMDNDMVNFLSNLLSCMLAGTIGLFLK
jgi:uncharacterized protein (TIGR00297 family)